MEKNYASTFNPGWHLPLAEGDSSHQHTIDWTSTPHRTTFAKCPTILDIHIPFLAIGVSGPRVGEHCTTSGLLF
ncbi:hypothetical protein ASPTUDRAFT_40866 [Aspergillus tubingensis CBS 134.48]|uniref:Uncharacterized protein n=1 Tax=Aspergillus tubingensis (strain CBS 134.48) TaxID=767770 RepID=A0A1L9N648_ASPTC|nr:hypothetical protein ASPTUDRAFT_40866 [Aspergillus tubingensis CBS 134.48]